MRDNANSHFGQITYHYANETNQSLWLAYVNLIPLIGLILIILLILKYKNVFVHVFMLLKQIKPTLTNKWC